MKHYLFESSYDPYDLWSTNLGVYIKRKYYADEFLGKMAAICIGIFDWLLPIFSRKILKTGKRYYPIVVAQGVQILSLSGELSNNNAAELLDQLKSISSDPSGVNGWTWGLGFPWMSKNGLYPESLPFITHTPYVMEALLELSKYSVVSEESMNMFDNTRGFLEDLLVMYEANDQLALSYAPVDEPRMVINANTYAALAYALHAVHGQAEYKEIAKAKVQLLLNWIVLQQQVDGSWYYYADNDSGNFIDCFHSCFIIKNLLKVKKLLNLNDSTLDNTINKGWLFIRQNFYDENNGLCKRFVERDIKDPFVWDLYDQAEYLGLLIDFGLKNEAQEFYEYTKVKFSSHNKLFSRIDLFNRKWGKSFKRWGIVPFMYYENQMKMLSWIEK